MSNDKDLMQTASENLLRKLGEKNAVAKHSLKAKGLPDNYSSYNNSVPATVRSEEDEDERRALEGLAEKAYDSALRASGDPALAMKIASDFSDTISQVFGNSGGSDNFVIGL